MNHAAQIRLPVSLASFGAVVGDFEMSFSGDFDLLGGLLLHVRHASGLYYCYSIGRVGMNVVLTYCNDPRSSVASAEDGPSSPQVMLIEGVVHSLAHCRVSLERKYGLSDRKSSHSSILGSDEDSFIPITLISAGQVRGSDGWLFLSLY
jgi:hypothetical protein